MAVQEAHRIGFASRARSRGEVWRSGGKNGAEERLARSLGWFSIGIGVAEVVAPRRMEKLIGVRDDHRRTIRAMGLREITHGVGILSRPRAAGWVWSRVGGDVADLAFLGKNLGSDSVN